MHKWIRTVPLLLSFALPLFSQSSPWTMTPDRGPASGGTRVTIKGPFGHWPYAIIFGDTFAPSGQRVADDTVVAITPAHLPGPVEMTVWEDDIGYASGLTFTFTEDDAAENFERVLLPIFTPEVRGAFGSMFFTNLIISNASTTDVKLNGLACEAPCQTESPDSNGDLLFLTEAGQDVHPRSIIYNGRPGRFLYVPKVKADAMAMSLVVSDLSRENLNFGTEMPIVKESEFRHDRVVLTGIPATPYVRNLLRIYGATSFTAQVRVNDGDPVSVRVEKPAGATKFDPAYGVFTNFPSDLPGKGWSRVTIDVVPESSPTLPIDTSLWAFVSVTNNETQAITTITPQP